jgi:tetratricopeptide (TPR) repeat protein
MKRKKGTRAWIVRLKEGAGMRLPIALLLGAFLVLAQAPGAAGQPNKPRAIQIIEQAEKNPNDRALLANSLSEIDREIASAPRLAVNHYVRGWLLSHLGRLEEAVRAYDKAVEIDPKFADAYYNAGVVLADLGRTDEALKRWYAATEADPKLVDAYYNAGQLHYNRKEFAKALDRWSKARALAPDDFDVAKKVLQAYNALGDRGAAVKAREAVFQIWRTSSDPGVRRLTEYVFDQFDVGKTHVYAYETFEPKGDLYYVYTFRVAGPKGKLVGSVQLESSAAIRKMGTPYILGVTTGSRHETLSQSFKALPAYDTLRPIVTKIIEERFAAAPK